MAPVSVAPDLTSRYCGIQPVAPLAQPVWCNADRNSWLRNGSPPAGRFPSSTATPARESTTSIEFISERGMVSSEQNKHQILCLPFTAYRLPCADGAMIY